LGKSAEHPPGEVFHSLGGAANQGVQGADFARLEARDQVVQTGGAKFAHGGHP
jgi:hypothetical protein